MPDTDATRPRSDATRPRGDAAPRLPAEFEPHRSTVMAWPCRTEIWGPLLRRAQLDYADIARCISSFEPVTMVARTADAAVAADLCGSGVDVIELPLDDSWARDIAPITVQDGPQHGAPALALAWTFNAWGEKFTPYADDARFAACWAEHLGTPARRVPMVLEGGSVCSDGEGTLLTTQQCLLHPNRNPGFTRAEIEAVLGAELGARCVVWLPYGLALDDDTDGHVDNVAAFTEPGVVLLQGCSDRNEPDRERLMQNKRWLQGSRDAIGRALGIIELPVLPFAEIADTRVAVPYLNLYVCNGGVIVPVSGHPADDDMCALVASAFPGRTVVPVPGTVLAYGGGGPHCITMQVPAC